MDIDKNKKPLSRRENARVKQLAKVERNAKIWELYRGGLTMREVGEKIGVAQSTVHKVINDTLKELGAQRLELGEGMLDVELERLEYLTKLCMKDVATSMDTVRNSDGSTDRVRIERTDGALVDRLIRISDRKAKLLGLDSPKEVEVTATLQDLILATVTPDMLPQPEPPRIVDAESIDAVNDGESADADAPESAL